MRFIAKIGGTAPAEEEGIDEAADRLVGSGRLGFMLTAAILPADAGASDLIGRNATGVRLQADANGRAAVVFRSEGQARVVVASGAVDARRPSRGRPQVGFDLQVGGRIGPNACTAYRGPPLAWLVTACTAQDGSHVTSSAH